MIQSRKIIIALLATIFLLCGLYLDLPKLLFLEYRNTQLFQIVNWSSLDNPPSPKKINVEEILADPIFSIDIKFRYKNEGKPYPNLFQTSNYNEGLRIEFSGNNAAIIYRCKNSCPPNGYNVVDLTKYLNFSSKNSINLIISQGKSIDIRVNSYPRMVIKNPPPNLKFDNILVGSGFDSTRGFNGSIEEFNLKSMSGSMFLLIQSIYYFSIVLLYLAVIFYLKKIPTKF